MGAIVLVAVENWEEKKDSLLDGDIMCVVCSENKEVNGLKETLNGWEGMKVLYIYSFFLLLRL